MGSGAAQAHGAPPAAAPPITDTTPVTDAAPASAAAAAEAAAPPGFELVRVPGDGNCFYHAVRALLGEVVGAIVGDT